MGKRNQWCVVPECRSDSRKHVSKYPFMRDVKFIPFPQNESLKRKWLTAIRRPLDYQPQVWHRVCSRHFVNDSDVPSLFPWNNYGKEVIRRPLNTLSLVKQSQKTNTTRSDTAHFIQDEYEDENQEPVSIAMHEHISVYDDILPIHKVPYVVKECEVSTGVSICQIPHHDHDYLTTNVTSTKISFKSTKCKDTGVQTDISGIDIDELKQENEALKSEKIRDKFMKTVTSNDKKVKFYTGICSIAVFLGVFRILEPVILKYYSGTGTIEEKTYENKGKKPGPARKLTKLQEYTITLIRLRHSIPVVILADIFNVSTSRISQVFTTWIFYMSEVFSPLTVWPSRQLVQKHMPKSFKKKFPKCVSIIDCTELFVQRPRNPTTQSKLYSNYKSHTTYKALVSITPTGAFNFVSDLWGGNTSDRYITEHSGYLENISPGDEVMADRGFTIRDLLTEKRAYLTIPPFTRKCFWGKGKRLNANEIKRTREIANSRIHVERAIQRLKQFKIISNIVHWSLKPLMNPILKVSAFLCNLMKPLVKK